MQINDLFVNKIDRYIDPVIKIEDEKNILQELEEYVVTDKIADNLIRFFEIFNETALDERKDVGVWISGFFGSGKSHFAKILGYLLENVHEILRIACIKNESTPCITFFCYYSNYTLGRIGCYYFDSSKPSENEPVNCHRKLKCDFDHGC